MSFGRHIRCLRTAHRLTLRELARRLEVSPTYLSQIEQENFPPPAENKIVRLAEILGQDVDELLGLAGRVADDLPKIIRQHPRAMATFLRTAQGLSAQQINELAKQAESLQLRTEQA
jgi:transcriptional regulator with XRE-family HTH domain